MANITVDATHVGVVYPLQSERYNVTLYEDVTAGAALYQLAAGTYGLAQADEIAKRQFRGIALKTRLAGQTVSMLKQGILEGYTLATYDDEIYLSDTAGRLSTTPGTMVIKCGRVISINDPAKTEVAYIEADWLREWGSSGEVP